MCEMSQIVHIMPVTSLVTLGLRGCSAIPFPHFFFGFVCSGGGGGGDGDGDGGGGGDGDGDGGR